MRKIIFLNLAIVCFWLISFCLFKFDFPYFIYLSGLIFFFLPGFNLTLSLEQLTAIRQGMGKIILWSFLTSVTLNLKIVYLLSYWQGFLAKEEKTLILFFLWWLVSLTIFSVCYFFKKFAPTDFSLNNLKKHKVFWFSLLFWFLFLTINFLLYRFLPGADPYKYILRVSEAIQTGAIVESSRSLFYAFSWDLLFLSKIPLYFLYKIIIPLFSAIILLVFYLYSSKINRDKHLLLFSTLNIVTFPVVAMEILMSRPQSIFLFVLPISLFLAIYLLKNKQINSFFWLFYLLLLILVGIRIHQFFLILLGILLIIVIVFYFRKIKENPWVALVLTAFSLPYFYRLLLEFNFISFMEPFWQIIIHPHFKLWFINNYTNIDGYQMGWPGYSFLLYYGYNLGLVLPILIILNLIKKIKFNFSLKDYWVYLLFFFIFFAVAEVFPRLGLNYLPDRAWLLAAFGLMFFIPPLINRSVNVFGKRIILIILTFLFLFSFGINFYLTYSKQGRITENEYKASQYMKNNLPEDAAVISQANNGVIIKHFANKVLVVPPDSSFFGQNWTGEELVFIDNLPDYISKKTYYLQRKEVVEKQISETQRQLLVGKTYAQIEQLSDQLTAQAQRLRKIRASLIQIINEHLDRERPVYVLYSNDQFNTLSGQRQWWREKNFYGADLEKFNNHPEYFKKIYDKDGIYIWEVKKQ